MTPWFIIIILIHSVAEATAFSVAAPRCRALLNVDALCPNQGSLSCHNTKRTNIVLRSKRDNDDDDTSKGLPVENDKVSQKKREETAPSTMTKLLLNITFAFAYLMIAIGGLLSIGLLLNIMGYGYQITPQGELRIDTIQRFREEAQFRNEVEKSMKEYRQQNQIQEKDLLSTSAVRLEE